MRLAQRSPRIYMDDRCPKSYDGIIFDCDGVLIDVTRSYDTAIILTVDLVLKMVFNISDAQRITPDIIAGFKKSGGFNNEVDLTYAAILSIYAAHAHRFDQWDVLDVAMRNSDHTGAPSVEKFLDTMGDVTNAVATMNHPGQNRDSIVYQIFMQIFFGARLYRKMFPDRKNIHTEQICQSLSRDDPFMHNTGFGKKIFDDDTRQDAALIDEDIVLLSDGLVSDLQKHFGSKMAIVTGRDRASTRYSLGALLDAFDDSSAFLEDEPREYAKPNPKRLYDVVSAMDLRSCLYVGDSMEDLIMARAVTDLGRKVTFCGITGTSPDPSERLKIFDEAGAAMVLNSIDDIPNALNLVSG